MGSTAIRVRSVRRENRPALFESSEGFSCVHAGRVERHRRARHVLGRQCRRHLPLEARNETRHRTDSSTSGRRGLRSHQSGQHPDGQLWAGLNYNGRGCRLASRYKWTMDSPTFSRESTAGISPFPPCSLSGTALCGWVTDKGLYGLSDGRLDHFDSIAASVTAMYFRSSKITSEEFGSLPPRVSTTSGITLFLFHVQ